MADEQNRINWTNGMLVAASLVVVVAGVMAAKTIVVPLLLAFFISVVVTPLFVFMRNKGIPAWASVLILTLVLVLAALGSVGVVSQSVRQFIANSKDFQYRLESQSQQLAGWLDEHGFEMPEEFLTTAIKPDVVVTKATKMAGELTSLLGNSFLILLVVIFFLLEASIIPAKVRAWPGMTDDTWSRLCTIVGDVRQYMMLKTMTSLATGVLIGVWVSVLGVGYSVLLGLLAFSLNYVPSIGSFIAAIPGVLLALVLKDLKTALMVAGGYLVVNVVIGNILEPRIMGKGLGLSPLVILISLIVWGWVLGPVGMLLSVPLTMAVKIALESGEQTKGIALLLGGKAPQPETIK